MNGVAHIVVACSMMVVGASGCSNSTKQTGSGDFRTDAPTAFATSDERLSQAQLDAAVAAVPDTSDFTYVLDRDRLGPLFSTEGTHHAGEGWAAVTTLPDPATGEDYTLRSVARGSEQWMQLDEWTDPRRGCWLPLKANQAPVGIQALRAVRPVPYELLGKLTSVKDGYTAPFGLAAQLLSVQTTELLGWNGLLRSPTPVPVDVVVTDGVVTSMRVEATDLLNVEPAAKGVPPAQVGLIRGIDVLMTFEDGRSYDATAPEPLTVILPGTDGCTADG